MFPNDDLRATEWLYASRMDGQEVVDEIPTCRICRSEEEPDAPLYHPCKCTGSIRYCHEDCLVQWLQHSQKKHCELCGYHFVFRKHYTHQNSGGIVPIMMYVRYFVVRLVQLAMYLLRLVVVAVTWFVLVPYATRRIWTSYIQSCDWFAEFVLRRPIVALSTKVADAPTRRTDSTLVALMRFIVYELTKDWSTSIALTIAVVVTFIGIFFLREHMMNAQILAADQAAVEENAPDHQQHMRQLAQDAMFLAQQRMQRMRELDVDALARRDQMQGTPPEDEDEWEDEEEPEAHQETVWEPRLHLEPRRRFVGALTPADTPLDEGEWVDETASDQEEDRQDDRHVEENLAPLPAPAIPNAEEEEADVNEENEELDENAEHLAEDIDATLHAVGLRGPWLDLGQTFILVQMLIIMTMSVCVAIPYGVGRVLGFRAYDMVLLPAKALRLITDPIFEHMIRGLAWLLPISGRVTASESHASSLSLPPWLSVPWQGFASIGKALDAYTCGGHITQRALCVILGHLYILLLLQLEARYGTWLHGGTTHFVDVIVKYYGTALKSGMIMLLDFLGFPVFCGLVIDWCFLPLFEGASIATLVGHAQAAPVSFFFTRWVSGTVYMFFFAQFLGGIRSVVRPGVMCWIRDNADPDFQPMAEMVEDSLRLQLLKMVESAIMCGAYAVIVIGGATRALHLVPGLLPLHWAPLTPRTLVPVELILIHFGLRIAVRRMRFIYFGKRLFRAFWIWTARFVRMSAYIMGDEQPHEHQRLEYASWADWARSFLQSVPATRVDDGGYARVPANDRPAPKTAMFIRTDKHGHPVDEQARELLQKQHTVLDTMQNKSPYTIVYVPSRLRLRLCVILVLLGSLCTFVVMMALGAPLLAGRLVGYWNAWPPVHDVYTWLVGCVVLGGLVLLGRAAYTLSDARQYQRLSNAQESNVKSMIRGTVRFVYHMAAFGGIVPLLTGAVLHLYILTNASDVPRFSAWYAWAYGALLLNAALMIALLLFPDHVPLLWDIHDHMQAGRLWRVPLGPVSRRILAPVVGALTAILAAPYVLAFMGLFLTNGLDAPITTQLKYVCAAQNTILVCAVCAAARLYIHKRLHYWTYALHDELYLASTELCNYEVGQHRLASDAFQYGSLPDAVLRSG